MSESARSAAREIMTIADVLSALAQEAERRADEFERRRRFGEAAALRNFAAVIRQWPSL